MREQGARRVLVPQPTPNPNPNQGALAKPLEDVLLAPFLERLQGKGKGFSVIDSAKLQSARIEVDGQSVDLSRPAASFVQRYAVSSR